MARLSPYIFSADARKQAEFYENALSGKILDIKTFADAPGYGEEDQNRVMHLVFQVGEATIFMADSGSSSPEVGSAIDLTLVYPNEEGARVAFDHLARGGKVLMPFERMFWGTFFGRLEDPFGIRWQISTES